MPNQRRPAGAGDAYKGSNGGVHEHWLFAALFLLTMATGMIDASSFLGLGNVFTANMTGNVLLLGFALTGSAASRAAGLSVGLSGTALGAFVFGAVSGGAITGRRGSTPRLTVGFVIEGIVLAGALMTVALGNSATAGTRYPAIALLGTAMGLQNATVRRMGLPDVNTTVLTTTLGGLAADVVEVGGRPANLGRRIATVVLLFAGAAIGAGLLQLSVTWALAGAVIVVAGGIVSMEVSRALRTTA